MTQNIKMDFSNLRFLNPLSLERVTRRPLVRHMHQRHSFKKGSSFFYALVVVFIELLSPHSSALEGCIETTEPSEYTALKTLVENEIQKLSSKNPFAKKADDTLSLLLNKKSPVILRWMEQRNFSQKSEDEVVSEWRVYYIKQFVLNSPKIDTEFKKPTIEFIKKMAQEFKKSSKALNLSQDFKLIQESAIKAVESWPIEADAKKQIQQRLRSIKLQIFDLDMIDSFKRPYLELLAWGVAYDPEAHQIQVGVESLMYPNRETRLAVIAHELGHSVDSCRWGTYMKGLWPFEIIGKCLRRSESAGAQPRDDRELNKFKTEDPELQKIITDLVSNPTCNSQHYPPIGIQADQLPESFADWFSTEVITTLPTLNLSQVRTDLCSSRKLNAGSSYPNNEVRLQKIIRAHPQFQASSKTPSGTYCSLSERRKDQPEQQ